MAFSCASLPLIVLNVQRVIKEKIVHLPCFKILQINTVLTSKLDQENSRTDVE